MVGKGASEDLEMKYKNFNQIVNTLYNEEIENLDEEEIKIKDAGSVKLEPKIYFDKFSKEMKVEFRIGKNKMYRIKNLSDFYVRMIEKSFYKYGEKLQFIHTKEMFEEDSRPLLEFLLKYSEIIKYANSNSNTNYKYYGKALSETSIIIGNSGIDDLFDILKGNNVQFQKDYTSQVIEFTEEDPKIQFVLSKDGEKQYVLAPNVDIYNVNIIKGKKYTYILDDKKLYRCSSDFEKTTLRLLDLFRKNYITEANLGTNELSKLFSIVMPKVKNNIVIKGIKEDELEKYKPDELIVKLYLDFDKNDYLIADVKFIYGEKEFNPLNEKEKLDIPRNMIKETKALNMFRKTGFMLETKNLRFILPNNDKIYKFLSEDINFYMENFEVLVTDNFKTKQIRQPQMSSLGVKISNNLLDIDLKDLDINKDEIKDIMEKYSLKKKYYRLKDGSFINLEENKEIEFLDKLITGMDIDYKQLEKGKVEIPIYRSFYLNQLLKQLKGTNVQKNSEYKQLIKKLNKEQIEEELEVPENLEKVLRYYQKIGYKWLKNLDNYRFGGILADDMGLGKTIQMLSIIAGYIEENSDCEKRASIVICPSSLTLNWQNESQKFTNKLKTLVIRGSAQERKNQIKNIYKYDLIITSYDLLKRDIEIYKENKYQFRFAITDEAQYLKNSNTQNAKAVKEILADTRYALTGTPIENSLAELWSIFDYIMPGYLFGYKKFKTEYEVPIVKDNNQNAMKKLKMLIEPFVLRRTKKEVLTELPEKTITVLNNQMKDEQEKIYLNYLAQAKHDIAETISLRGFEKSHIQVLAALTRLRQICCHPSLFIKDYQEGSSKLEQCIEIVKDATEAGHKILLFSGYTSMFELIQKELEKNDITYFKLTGSTKVDERIRMVDEFNENKDIKVFLISLKAGGTGLNLTGADMVIHYDPWWNASAENQATDRAYRIGQKNNVQVYKLITKNSIEERIYDLQQKKSELIDNVLDTKTSFISKLSKDDIMKLFE